MQYLHYHLVTVRPIAITRERCMRCAARQDGSTPIAEASYAGHADIVKTLIESEADVGIARKVRARHEWASARMVVTSHRHVWGCRS